MPSPPPASQAQGRKLGLACKGTRSTSCLPIREQLGYGIVLTYDISWILGAMLVSFFFLQGRPQWSRAWFRDATVGSSERGIF